MSDFDEGRDVRAAFGTLLADEPTSPWSVSDDVARGRALQRRRRTRAGAGIGLVAAAVMVFGVFGPWRPKPAAVAPPASSSVELEQQVTDVLADLGWETDGVARVSNEPGSPEVRVWTAHRADGDAGLKAKLALRTWDESSWSAGADGINDGSVIAQCDDTTCMALARRAASCAKDSVCWSESSALLTQPIDGAESGSYVLYRSDESGMQAVEVVVGPEQCPEVCPGDPYTAFLTEGEAARVVERVQTLLVAPPTPSPAPTPSLTPRPTGIAAVTQVLEGFGFRVNTAQEFSGRDGWYFDVDVDPTADNPVDAVLTLAFFSDDGVAVGSERVAVVGSVMNGCDEKACERVDSITVPCPSNDCFQDWATTTTAAYDGVDPGTLVVFRSDGSRAIEAVVGVRSCPTCAPAGVGGAFLTLEQTQEVLAAAFVASAEKPSPSRPAIAACTNNQVKLVPAVGSSGGATGERSLAIEVYARNPSVSCTVEGFPSAVLLVGAQPAADLVYRQGTYNVPDADRGGAVVVDSSHAAVFVVAKYRCDTTATVGRADAVAVGLGGWSTSVTVELSDGLALELCGDAATERERDVWVSAFTPREGGVS